MNTDELLDLHVRRFASGDLEGLMSEYAPDVVFFTQQGVLHGPDAVRPLVAAVLAEFSLPGVSFELQARGVSGDFAYLAWRAETPKHVYALGSDTFVFREGRIVMQSAAVAATPPA